MNDNRESLARMGGWLVSLTLHGLSLGTALVLAAEFSILPEPRPFRWEVTMVSAPALQPVAADVPTPFSASSVSPSVMPRDKSPRQVRSRPNAANTEAARPLEAHSGIIAPAQDGFVRPQATENPSLVVDSVSPGPHTPSADLTSDELVHEAPQVTRVDLPVTTTEPSDVPPPSVDVSRSIPHDLHAFHP
jgi:protein TonB